MTPENKSFIPTAYQVLTLFWVQILSVAICFAAKLEKTKRLFLGTDEIILARNLKL